MNLLVPGGAGYIGSHMVKLLQDHNHEVVILDNFSTGHQWAVQDCEIWNVDILDKEKLSKLMKTKNFDAVFHFAAKSLVGESFTKPMHYYENNVLGSINIINEMIRNDIQNIVFPSTAAIFGSPKFERIDESHSKLPINPYGQSKLIVENILNTMCLNYGINATCFRYFNAAGAHETGLIGEAHEPETHLIPNVLRSSIDNKINLEVFGNSYDTNDGTCIRDYIHVSDLAEAHLLGLEFMNVNSGFAAFNLGNGNGFSVFEIIKTCEQIVGKQIHYDIKDKREGDPPKLVADSRLAFSELGWKPKHNTLDTIIHSAWNWHRKFHAKQ